jgi:hypothetical protein
MTLGEHLRAQPHYQHVQNVQNMRLGEHLLPATKA